MSFFDKFRDQRRSRGPIEEVVENLTALLSTRRGFGALDERLGLSDFNSAGLGPEPTARIMEEVAENIRLFEPRAELVAIEPLPSRAAGRPRLRIDLRVGERELPLTLDLSGPQPAFSTEPTEPT